MFCGKCGNKLKGTEKFCTKCGNKIPEKQKVNQDVKQTEKPVMIDSNIEDNIVENKTNADILEKNEKIDAQVSKEEIANNQEEIIESEKKEEIIEPKEEIEKKENPEVKEETQVEKPELDYKNLFLQIAAVYEVFDFTCEKTDLQTSYTANVTGEQVQKLLETVILSAFIFEEEIIWKSAIFMAESVRLNIMRMQ